MANALPITWIRLAGNMLDVWAAGYQIREDDPWQFPPDWTDPDKAEFLRDFQAEPLTAGNVIRFIASELRATERGPVMPSEMPAHWLRLAGELIRESQPANDSEPIAYPDDWTADEEADFRASVFAWLNEDLPEPVKYNAGGTVLRWMAHQYLGGLLVDSERESEQEDHRFATTAVTVSPQYRSLPPSALITRPVETLGIKVRVI